MMRYASEIIAHKQGIALHLEIQTILDNKLVIMTMNSRLLYFMHNTISLPVEIVFYT